MLQPKLFTVLKNGYTKEQFLKDIIAGIIVYALLGILIDLAMRVVERLALPWRPSLVPA